MERKEDGGFDPEEYDQHPELYLSTFSKKIAPYASVIINGIYWAVDSPKLLTIPDAKYLLRPANTPWLPISVGAPALPHRMLAICDISADPGGSIEYVCTRVYDLRIAGKREKCLKIFVELYNNIIALELIITQ